MSNQMAQLQEATIKAHCKTLRMPMIASQFGTLAEQAIREKKNHIGYLEALLLAEVEERERNTIERRIREAHLPRMKTLEEFDYTQSPNVNAAKMQIMARMTPRMAMWLWLIFGGIFAASGLTAFISAIGGAGLLQTLRFIVAGCFLMISAACFRNAWNAYRDGRNPKQ